MIMHSHKLLKVQANIESSSYNHVVNIPLHGAYYYYYYYYYYSFKYDQLWNELLAIAIDYIYIG